MALSYRTWGSPNQPALLMLHGFLGFGSDWEDIAQPLSEDFFCIAPDLPGHGNTALDGFTADRGFDQISTALLELLENLEIGETSLLGYSMGGRIACYLATRHPVWFSSLVLESASPGLKSDTEREERLVVDQDRGHEIKTGDYQKFLEKWYRQPLFENMGHQPARLTALIQSRLSQDSTKLAGALDIFSIGRQPDLWSSLSASPVPLLLVVGEFDDKYRNTASEIAASRRGSTAIRVIPGTGHNSHWERPEIFAEAIRTFLKST